MGLMIHGSWSIVGRLTVHNRSVVFFLPNAHSGRSLFVSYRLLFPPHHPFLRPLERLPNQPGMRFSFPDLKVTEAGRFR
jgi:hypothetical protein